MSTKDLFNKGYSLKFLKNKTLNDFREDLESHRYVSGYAHKRARFLPSLNFATASNFARFGLAEEYYETSIKRIYETYPYDGSLAEKTEWENDSTYLDLFLFENEYPRSNGFVNINPELNNFAGSAVNNLYSSSAPQYVLFYGGPHVDPGGDYKNEPVAGPSRSGASKANVYDTGTKRVGNLDLNAPDGLTVEFWLKKDGWHEVTSAYEVIFSNQVTGSLCPNPSYFVVQARGSSTSTINVAFVSGSDASTAAALVALQTNLSNIADGNWHHYAITAKNENLKTHFNLYVDGLHVDRKTNSANIQAITGSQIAAIGALPDKIGSSYGAGWGNIVSASIDEFRFWKTERNAQEIGRNWRSQVDGGTNTDNVKYDDVSNFVDLGVYFKFNEGISGKTLNDSVVLDYSGRISNGTFVGYDATATRDTGSAIVQSGVETKEFKDPIIYSDHPLVSSLLTTKIREGRRHDNTNPSSIYRSLPGWIAEQDEENSKHLKYLTQIIASFFDDLYVQMEAFPKLKDINYPNDTLYEKSLPFANRLLDHRGFEPPEIFAHASALAKYLERDEKKLFEKKLYEVKNIIYQNIYNNLTHIQKTKGTFKSLRNFLRCFGIDEEIVKLNIYSNDDEFELKDNFTNSAVKKRYLDFDDLETRLTASGNTDNAYTATAYQITSSTDSNSLSYIPAITEAQMSGAAFTLEAEVLFPKRDIGVDKNFTSFGSSEVSLFGLDAVGASNTDYTYAADNTINFNIIATKPDNDKRNVKFKIATEGGSTILDNLSNDNSLRAVYNNEKWNLAFRLRPTKAQVPPSIQANSGSGFLEPAATAYTYELYGANYLSNILQDEFTLAGTMSLAEAAKFFTSNKKVFAGAKRTNFTGSVERLSDVKVSSVRFWLDYLDDDTIKAHAKDATSFGTISPFKNSNFAIVNDSLSTKRIPQADTLVFHWSLDNVTGSNALGQFFIDDTVSGSATDVAAKRYGWYSTLTKKSYPAQGDFFVGTDGHRDQAIDVEFVQTAKKKLPEIVNSDDMVKILNKQDDVVFTRDTTYVQHLLSIEKSMYQIMSEQMLQLFATAKDFNNLIGEPVNRYRPDYKALSKLRNIFFERVENQPDLEKFTEYFKWLDDSISLMITQLIPASSNTVELLRNMIESHILERNKYWTKFPTLEAKPAEFKTKTHGIEELKYNWRVGHSPLNADENTNQNTNCLWWKQRAERNDALSSGNAGIDADKNVILKTYITEVSSSSPTLVNDAGTKYQESYYKNRSLRRVVDLESERSLKIKGGGNSQLINRHDFYKSVIKWNSTDDYIFIDVNNKLAEKDCNDKFVPDETNKKRYNLTTPVFPNDENVITGSKGSLLLPFSIYTSSVDQGYQNAFSSEIPVDFTNIHEDKYGIDIEVPLQGPFAEKHVGGLQHRHVKLNDGNDGITNRAEGWLLKKSSATYKLLHPTEANKHRPYATMMRSEFAKRPVNIRNIQTTGSSPTQAGNYLERYEYVNTVSPEANDPWFVKNSDQIQSTTPEMLRQGGRIKDLVGLFPGTVRRIAGFQDFTLPDRSFLSGTIKNKTRIKTRFSSPGGFETLSRGYLDPAHETYSVYNEINFRNLSARLVFNTQLQAHQGKFGVSAHEDGERNSALRASKRITCVDGDRTIAATGDVAEKQQITITSTDGTTRRYVITNAASDGTTVTGDVLESGTDTGAGTAGADEVGGIAVSINFSTATQNDFLVELLKAIDGPTGHAGKFKVTAPPAEADGTQFFILTQIVPGKFGTQFITHNITSNLIGISTLDSFSAVTRDPTARVFGSEQRGSIVSYDYSISGDASRHKYHRNNVDRIRFVGDDTESLSTFFITGSFFDNGFVSHAIPKDINQQRWITASIN